MAAPKITLLSNPNRTSPNTDNEPQIQPHNIQPISVIPGTDIPISLQNTSEQQTQNDLAPSDEIDFLLVTALRDPTHRFFILKLDRELENFLRDQTIHVLEFPSMSTFRRLIIHRVANYFKLEHHVSGNPNISRRPVVLLKTPNSQIPVLRLSELTTQEEQIQKKVKILNRTNPSKPPTNSVLPPSTSPMNPIAHNSPNAISVKTRPVSPQSANTQRTSQPPKRKKVIVTEFPSEKESSEETISDSKVLTQREVDYAKARARIFDEPFNEDEYTIIPDPVSPDIKQTPQLTPSQPLSSTHNPSSSSQDLDLNDIDKKFNTLSMHTANQPSSGKDIQENVHVIPQKYPMQPPRQVPGESNDHNLSRPYSEPRLSQVNSTMFTQDNFGGFSTPQDRISSQNPTVWNGPSNYHQNASSQVPNNMRDRLSPDHFHSRTWNPSHSQVNAGAGFPVFSTFSPPQGDYRHQVPPGMVPVSVFQDVRTVQQFPVGYAPPTYPYPPHHVPSPQNNFNVFRNMNPNDQHMRSPYSPTTRRVGKPVLYDFSETTPANPVDPVREVPPHILELAELNPQTPKDDPGIEEIRRRGATIKKLGNNGLFIAIFKSTSQAIELRDASPITNNFRLVSWSGKLK